MPDQPSSPATSAVGALAAIVHELAEWVAGYMDAHSEMANADEVHQRLLVLADQAKSLALTGGRDGAPASTGSPDAELRLAAIQARLQSASAGPWELGWSNDGVYRAPVVWPGTHGAPVCRFDRPGAPEKDRADATFIAHSRGDMEWLLAQVRSAYDTLAATRSALGAVQAATVRVRDTAAARLRDAERVISHAEDAGTTSAAHARGAIDAYRTILPLLPLLPEGSTPPAPATPYQPHVPADR